MRSGRRLRSFDDASGGREAGPAGYSEDFEGTGLVGMPRRPVGSGVTPEAPGYTKDFQRRMAQRRAVAELRRLGWRPAEIALALGVTGRYERMMARSNRELAKAMGRV